MSTSTDRVKEIAQQLMNATPSQNVWEKAYSIDVRFLLTRLKMAEAVCKADQFRCLPICYGDGRFCQFCEKAETKRVAWEAAQPWK